MSKEPELQKAKLNLETAQVAWTELQRFFAQGAVIWVDESLDLIDVAHCMAQDDSKAIRHWMRSKVLSQVSDEQAKKWLSEEAWLWSVVVRPLVLVQQIKSSHS
jgi:hypothetical protein